jgi:hypothetical protein
VTFNDDALRNGVAWQKPATAQKAERMPSVSNKHTLCVTWFWNRLQELPLADTASQTFQAHNITLT